MALTNDEKFLYAFSLMIPMNDSCIHTDNRIKIKDISIYTKYIFKSDRSKSFKNSLDILKEHNIDYELKYEAYANSRNEIFRYAVQINLNL